MADVPKRVANAVGRPRPIGAGGRLPSCRRRCGGRGCCHDGQVRLGSLAACTTLMTLTAACAFNSSGCENFNPKSKPLQIGETATVDVEIIGDRVGTLDVNGGYYVQPDTVQLRGVEPAASPRERAGVVRLEAAGLSLTVDGQALPLEGPLGCE